MNAGPPLPDQAYDRLVRSGTWLAGGAGVLAASAISTGVIGGVPSDIFGTSIMAGSIVGAGLAMAGLWHRLVPRRNAFSIVRALLAGVLAGIGAHAAAWLSAFLLMALVTQSLSMDRIFAFLGLVPIMTWLSLALIGGLTLPVAIAISTFVAIWCRWRSGRLSVT